MPAARRKAKGGLLSGLFGAKAAGAEPAKARPAPEPKPPAPAAAKGGSRLPFSKNLMMGISAVVIVIVLIVIAALFVLPALTSGGTTLPGSTTTTAPASAPTPQGTFVVPEETPPPVIPATGVWVHISYLGAWEGEYGMSGNPQSIINSGDRMYEIENANGTIEASFKKLDGSTRHALSVELYKNGVLLSQGSSSDAYGEVSISADAGPASATPAATTAPETTVTTTTTAS
jgi:hypothetical protein